MPAWPGPHTKFRRIAADGTIRWYADRGQLRAGAGGRVRITGIMRDITEQRNAEIALQQSEERLRNIIDTSSQGCWQVDSQARTVLCNRKMAEILGCDIEYVRARTALDFTFPEDAGLVDERMALNLDCGNSGQFDFRLRCKDGSEVHVLACTNAVRSPDGPIVGALGMFSNIADRKRREKELLDSEDRYRRIVEAASEAICIINPQGQVVFANEVASALTGCSLEEALGMSVFDVLHPEDTALGKERFEASSRGIRNNFETRLRRKDGTDCSLSVSANPMFEQDRFTGVLISAICPRYTEIGRNPSSCSRT